MRAGAREKKVEGTILQRSVKDYVGIKQFAHDCGIIGSVSEISMSVPPAVY